MSVIPSPAAAGKNLLLFDLAEAIRRSAWIFNSARQDKFRVATGTQQPGSFGMLKTAVAVLFLCLFAVFSVALETELCREEVP